MIVEIIVVIGVTGFIKSEIRHAKAIKAAKTAKLQRRLSAELAEKTERERRAALINAFLSQK